MTTERFIPPAAEDLPEGALDSAAEGANRLDAWALDPRGRNFLAHALVQLARDGWLRTAPAAVPVPPPADQTASELASLAFNAGRALQDEKRHYEIACQENARLWAVVARIQQMADYWEQQLPEVIRTPAVVSAIRAALERVNGPSRVAAEEQPAETQGCCGKPAGAICVHDVIPTTSAVETLPPPEGPEYTPCVCDHIGPEHEPDAGACWSCDCESYRPTPPAPLLRSEDACPGFPERCPNLRTVDPSPPTHLGGIRCGCADPTTQ